MTYDDNVKLDYAMLYCTVTIVYYTVYLMLYFLLLFHYVIV